MNRWVVAWVVTVPLLGVACAIAWGLGGDFILEGAFALAFGWALFLSRVVPRLSVDPGGVVVAFVCLVALVIGLHLFLRWLYSKIKQAKAAEPGAAARWRVRWTVMILSLVVLAFVSGISAVGITHQTAWLFRSERLYRRNNEVGPRWISINNLKLMGVGLHDHATKTDEQLLPSGGTFDAQGNALHGWQTPLLPYVDRDDLFRQIDQQRPWHDPKNVPVFQTVVRDYRHPKGGELHDDEGFALTHYAANVHLLNGGPPRSLKSITDGTSNTIMAGEVWAAYKPWGHHANWRDPARGIHTTPDSFGSPMSSEYAMILMADGSVRRITKSVSRETLKALSTPDGGEPLGNDW
jgi:hypothetical protein